MAQVISNSEYIELGQIEKLIAATTNPRDKAFISLLSGLWKQSR